MSMDCTDIRALLSGLLDDELEQDVRHDAERHLAECDTCRSLVDETEQLDALIVADATSIAGSTGLPEGFEARVLARTSRADTPLPYTRRWTTWAGWVAAAACLTMAVTIWITDRRAGLHDLGTGAVRAATYDTGHDYRSVPRSLDESVDTAVATVDMAGLQHPYQTSRWVPTRDEAQVLYTASTVVRWIAEADQADNLERARQAIVVESLTEQLDRMRLRPEDEALIRTASAIFRRASSGALQAEDVDFIRETAMSHDLANALDRISLRYQDSYSL